MSQSTLRLFIGIPLNQEWSHLLQQWVNQQGKLPLKWVRPDNYHLTLFFFGATPVDMLPNLLSLIDLAIKGRAPFKLAFSQVQLAPKPSRPRMIWARFQKTTPFLDLVQSIHQLFLQIQPSHQSRFSPLPHVTVARIPDPVWVEKLVWPKLPFPDSLPVNEVVLWESELVEGGSVYRPVKSWRLG